jgi:hypothetical protein
VALAAVPAAALAPAQEAALDTVARALADGPGRRALVRYTDPAFAGSSRSWEVARRVWDNLVARGIDPSRVTLVRVAGVGRVGRRPPPDAVEVFVAADVAAH